LAGLKKGNKLLIDYYKYIKMPSDDNGAEIGANETRSNKRAKSSPTLFSLFEKVVDIVKKYW